MAKLKVLLVILAIAACMGAGATLGRGPAAFGLPYDSPGVFVEIGPKQPDQITTTGGTPIQNRGFNKLDQSAESPMDKILKLAGLKRSAPAVGQ
jgi:hypothetical protein